MLTSRYFTNKEKLASAKAEELGIPNTPSMDVWETLGVCGVYMDRVREALNFPVHVHSWFRCIQLNRALGSKDTSQHLAGEAVDFTCPQFGSPLEIVQFLSKHVKELNIDQLILEHTWVHISFAIHPARLPRGVVLTLLENGKYATGITTKQGKEICNGVP